jgi:hypothetical protein
MNIKIKFENILHTSGSYDIPYHKDSIMSYGKICNHDDGYLCEHRRKYIIDLLKKIEISDEQIFNAAKESRLEDLITSVGSFELGAQWYREQLKNLL